jgi:polar amino acid transport system permease protein
MSFYDPQNFAVFMGQMLKGTLITLEVFVVTLVLSMPLGFLATYGKMSKFKPLSWLTNVYIYVFRGTPLLLQVVFFYYGLLLIGIKIDRMTGPLIAFVLNYAAYFAEIYRGGIQSMPRGQYEAAHVLGLSGKQTFFKIILPQVVKTVYPSVTNEVITLVKDTALVTGVSVVEILRTSMEAVNTYSIITPLAVAFVFYLVLNSLITFLLNKGEKLFAYYK